MNNDSLAQRLICAHHHGTRIDANPATVPADAQAAYAVQAAVWRALAGETRPRAWKVGAASPTETPLAAPVWPGMTLTAPASIKRSRLPRGKAEAEIALRFGCDLPVRDQPYHRDEILAAIDMAFVAMELVETRLADAKAAGPLLCLADSLLNGALVLGDAISDWRERDFSHQQVRVMADGNVLAEGECEPPLGDLFHCLPWWIGHVGGARAGDIVTTGAWNGAHDVGAVGQVEVEFAGLGRASLKVAEMA